MENICLLYLHKNIIPVHNVIQGFILSVGFVEPMIVNISDYHLKAKYTGFKS